jgi:cell division protein FtsW
VATTTRRPGPTTTKNTTGRRSAAQPASRRTGSSSSNRAAPARRRTTSGSATRSTRRAEVEVIRSGPNAESLLLGSVAVLCLLGLVMVYSASSVASVQDGGANWMKVIRQFAWMLIGLALALGATRLPARFWRDRVAGPLLVVAVFLQALLAADVLLRAIGASGLPFAVTAGGATRWIGIGPLSAQPSDLAKLAIVLWLARLLDVRRREIGSPELLKPVLCVTGLVAVLVMAGDDLGTTLLIGVVVITMLFLAGAPLRQVTAISAGGATLAFLAILSLEGFRLRRIAAFLQPEQHAATEGWQLLQSRIGFASGGLLGNGPGNSRAKWGYLPAADNDFILAVIGEELGLVGSLVVLGAFAVFMLAGIRLALRCRTRFSRLVAFGITTWIGVQALINIGVTVGTLPTKGITLPFVSYGGSSLMMCLFAVGVLVSVTRDR